MKILTSIFASVFLAAASAQAQDGPSYEETVKFIQNKMDDQNSSGKSVKLKFPERCIAEKTVSQTTYNQYDGWHTIKSKFDLSLFDPSRVSAKEEPGYGGSVTMVARENRQVIIQEITQRFDNYRDFARFKNEATFYSGNCVRSTLTCSEVGKDSYISMYNVNRFRDNGPRMARALSHLIKLCGGTEELF